MDKVAFQIPASLMRRARAVVEAVRREPTDRSRVDELVEVIVELTEAGLDFYFLEPLRRAEVGVMAASAANLGVAAAGRGMPSIIRRVISSLDEDQLLSITAFMEEILIPATGGEADPGPGEETA